MANLRRLPSPTGRHPVPLLCYSMSGVEHNRGKRGRTGDAWLRYPCASWNDSRADLEASFSRALADNRPRRKEITATSSGVSCDCKRS